MTAEPAEFPRPLALGAIPAEGRDLLLQASPAECAALAARFHILAVASLTARLHLRPEPTGGIRVTGRLAAEVVQECVVSFDPVAQRVDEPVELRLLPPGLAPNDGPEEPDEIESRPDGLVDLGEAIAEQLALALDHYPRAPGAVLPAELDAGPEHPFAGLAALRRPN
jgi:uncharacterized metal-binding protein YceD (DUF177 family)